jgi:PEP-CTERM motif
LKNTALLASPWLLAFAVSGAQADSSASASLSFSVLSGPGFSWLNNGLTNTTSDASAAQLTGWNASAGVFSPVYGPATKGNQQTVGTAVPTTEVTVAAGDVFGSAVSFSAAGGRFATLSANALVVTQGKAEANSFAQSWFRLAPGASVTFQGSLFLSVAGTNPVLPANYSGSDFYGFASGLLAVGSDERSRELGTFAVGSAYNLSEATGFALTVTNSGTSTSSYFLDSGVSVYTASAVPEPATYALWSLGLLGLVAAARRRAKTPALS